jgi:hypothetical protein
MTFLKNHSVNIAIAVVFLFSVWLSGNLGAFDQQNIKDDVICYHAYAPALFVKHDLKLNFYKDSAQSYADRKMYWATWQKNGNPVIKTSCGQEIMYLPFTAGVFMYYAGENISGYEIPFSIAICISTLVYFFLSLILLKKVLRHFSFSENSIALTIICLGLGTNLLSYTTAFLGMPHVSDFFLLTSVMYLLLKWFEEPKLKHSILIGVCFGLLVLIRPTNVLLGFLILFYGVTNGISFKQNFKFLLHNTKHLVVIAVAALLVFSPQLFYWKYATGNWFYFSYVGEQFFYDKPHLLEYLVGFRKGWFVYSPLIVLAIGGLFFNLRGKNKFFVATILIVVLMVYLNCSWWCWWFGGGFGARAMIEVYPLLAIGFCCFFETINLKKYKSALAGVILTLLLLHNIKSSYLARINKIHYDSMTFKAYQYLFFKVNVTKEDDEYLETVYVHPDYDKARKGIDT